MFRDIPSRRRLIPMVAVCLAAVASAASADDRAKADFERDRASILAMAGEFRVQFDMRETVSFLPDYQPIEPKTSVGHEVVRVVEDTGKRIRLQHLLVVTRDKEPIVIKHWRQDWQFEPETVLVSRGKEDWALEPLSAEQRRGVWSQTVWQTDDSPRYGGTGRWTYDAGVARWTTHDTRRPLARRDAERKPPYDHYIGMNRHALTPTGWVHEQDNAKIGTRDGKQVTFVHEVVLNSYVRSTDFAVTAADDYWTKTSEFWAAVRKAWDDAAGAKRGLRLTDTVETASSTMNGLSRLAREFADGKKKTEAIEEARQIIADRSGITAPVSAQAR